MTDEKNAKKKSEENAEIISLDDEVLGKIVGGVNIGGMEYYVHTIGNKELEDGHEDVTIDFGIPSNKI